MRNTLIKFLSIVSLGFLTLACAPKTYKHNEARFIFLKTPQIKFADLGYIRHTKDEVKVELFSVGQLVQSIEINTLICVDEGCISKSSFNEDYLCKYYPDNLLRNVLLGKPIFSKVSLQRTKTGFIQKLKSDRYNIVYKVDNKNISFKDKQNHFLIKIETIR
ncbi:hypothetical protein JHD50_12730 [Sulfurimonas sp. MAG313]|nr:hypothetical protein [Sulfurimonas sp. MAG313]MDF1882152.1 hypothetical protein [Sulfurimonas sp. MAG313]